MNKLGNRPIFKDTKEPRCAVKVPTYQLYGNCDRVIVSGCVTALQWSSSARVGLLVGNALRLSASDERVDSSLRNSGSSSSSNEEAESVSVDYGAAAGQFDSPLQCVSEARRHVLCSAEHQQVCIRETFFKLSVGVSRRFFAMFFSPSLVVLNEA